MELEPFDNGNPVEYSGDQANQGHRVACAVVTSTLMLWPGLWKRPIELQWGPRSYPDFGRRLAVVCA